MKRPNQVACQHLHIPKVVFSLGTEQLMAAWLAKPYTPIEVFTGARKIPRLEIDKPTVEVEASQLNSLDMTHQGQSKLKLDECGRPVAGAGEEIRPLGVYQPTDLVRMSRQGQRSVAILEPVRKAATLRLFERQREVYTGSDFITGCTRKRLSEKSPGRAVAACGARVNSTSMELFRGQHK